RQRSGYPLNLHSVLVSWFIEAPMQTRFSPLGLVLFAVYLLLYSGFVLLNAFAPDSMEATPVAGLNVAILYGFALIVFAVILSMVYGLLCKDLPEDSTHGQGEAK